MQKIPKNASYQSQNLIPPLYTQCTVYSNGNKSAAEMHYHTCEEIGICTSGSGIFFIGERVCSFTKGSVTYMPRETLHIAQSPAECPSEWKYIFADVKRLSSSILIQKGMIIADKDCYHLVNMLFDELTEKPDQYETTYKYLMECLLIRLHRMSEHVQQSNQTYSFFEILAAVNYISKNYNSEIRVAELAQMCQISKSLFYRVFRAVTDMSPIEYLNSVRISSAENLLKFSRRSILEIALEVGFPTVSSFYRQFKKINLCSPKDYRSKYLTRAL